MSEFLKLSEEVVSGILGKNESIPIGLPKLGKYAAFRKRIFTLLFSSTGAGKSSLADEMMLSACEDYIKRKNNDILKPKFILFSMERAKHYRIAKWIVRRIFLDHQIEISVPKLLGWWHEKLTKDEHDLFLLYEDYIQILLTEFIDIYETPRTPGDIYKIVKTYFEEAGKYENITEYKKIYIPNDEKIVVIPILDHGNLTRTSKALPKKKEAVDELCRYMQGFRDLEGASPFWIAQVGRSISNPLRLKDTEAELVLDDVKESGDMGDACDIALSLYDPLKYNQGSRTGYNPVDFRDVRTGAKYFRSIQICKSSYGEDDLRIPLSFNGFCGSFKELPKRSELKEDGYRDLVTDVLNKSYFL